MNRRNFVRFAGALAFASAFNGRNLRAQEEVATPEAPLPQRRTPPSNEFSFDRVVNQAEALARSDHNPPRLDLPAELADLDRESYQAIKFKDAETLWRGEPLNFRFKFLHTGFQYRTPLEIAIVENGEETPFSYSPTLFDFNPPLAPPPAGSRAGFSGFSAETRLHSAEETSEFLTFQGATFFRAVASGQVFGLSARALSVNTAQSRGEEFPFFRKIWIERPPPRARTLTLHALLDGPSVAGAYTFRTSPGDSTVIDVQCILFPRVRLDHAGIAPISSMYFHGGADFTQTTDFRPNVHSSDGLQIWNAFGDWIWRPITNPDQLQYSVFVDRTPHGFGLLQRRREFAGYEDLDSRFDLQPSLWVEPAGDWREGAVDLIEIPSQSEIFNNIIAFWRPRYPLEAGRRYSFSYRLHWGANTPIRNTRMYASQTLVSGGTGSDDRAFVIDFVSRHSCAACSLEGLDAELRAADGEFRAREVKKNPATGGYRVRFEYRPGRQQEVDVSCQLKHNGQVVSETWLYRFSR